jgi:hypothetical protein
MHLSISEADWLAAIRANLPEALCEANAQAFAYGRSTVKTG